MLKAKLYSLFKLLFRVSIKFDLPHTHIYIKILNQNLLTNLIRSLTIIDYLVFLLSSWLELREIHQALLYDTEETCVPPVYRPKKFRVWEDWSVQL